MLNRVYRVTVLLKTEISFIQKKVDELNYHNAVKEMTQCSP